MPDIAENTLFLSPTSVQEIEREIKLLNPKKASGPDNIGAKVMKLCPHIFAYICPRFTIDQLKRVNTRHSLN